MIGFSINLSILECKEPYSWTVCIRIFGINLSILECKGNLRGGRQANLCINLNTLECKDGWSSRRSWKLLSFNILECKFRIWSYVKWKTNVLI